MVHAWCLIILNEPVTLIESWHSWCICIWVMSPSIMQDFSWELPSVVSLDSHGCSFVSLYTLYSTRLVEEFGVTTMHLKYTIIHTCPWQLDGIQSFWMATRACRLGPTFPTLSLLCGKCQNDTVSYLHTPSLSFLGYKVYNLLLMLFMFSRCCTPSWFIIKCITYFWCYSCSVDVVLLLDSLCWPCRESLHYMYCRCRSQILWFDPYI